jgi:RimJ/RimL family protein N-acetyltransferase
VDPRLPSLRPVDIVLPRPRPERKAIEGDRVSLEPLDPDRHGPDLWERGHDGTPEAEQSWDYLPYGPFASEADHRSWLRERAAGDDPLFFAIVERGRGGAAGVASLMSVVPEHASIELGHVWLAPSLQRTPAATEALVALIRHAMEDLGYRRMEWKCDAANRASRRAAVRLGYRFEGIFFHHQVVKRRNRDTAWYSILDDEWPRLRGAYATWLAAGNFAANGAQKRRLSELTG